MLKRRYLFPNVIEMNYQAGHRLGVNIYLIEDGGEYALIDIGYEDTVDEIIEMIRQMDFSLSACKYLIATHADVDHTQGFGRAKEVLRCPIVCHPACVEAIETGDSELTFSRIKAQGIDLPMPKLPVEKTIDEGDTLEIGSLKLDVWSTPGHATGQLAFKMRNLLFVGDNIYRDSSVGVIDAHHGSSLPEFLESLNRILKDDAEFMLPSHGPVFRRDNAIVQKAIDRLTEYQYLADFGTCAIDWPVLREWEAEIASGEMPDFSPKDSSAGDSAGKGAAPDTTSGSSGKRLPGALS